MRMVLDTNVIIDHLRQQGIESILDRLVKNMSQEDLAISVLTVQELYEGKSISNVESENYLISTISPIKLLPYTYEVAEMAGTLNRNLPQPIEFPDAAIAATAILNEAQLFTLNKKDFAQIPKLELYEN